MKRFLAPVAGLALAAATVGFGASAAGAATPSPSNPAGHSHEILGVVPPRSQAHNNAGSGGGGGNLMYHGGPVMHTNKVYAIYWVPSGYSVQNSTNYQTLINRFFTDVAADSGASSSNPSSNNVYYSDTQYYDSAGTNIAYWSQFGGPIVDTNALPASGCRDSYTSVCLTDSQITTEIKRVINGNSSLTPGPTTEFFMFTPKGVGSCSGSSCAFSNYCAYHGWSGSGSSVILYANMPYADTVPAACDAGQSPNGDDADATINVTSHEHNETITDEQGNAWYDRRGYENGDKCAWNFGTALGGTSSAGTLYNQVINNHNYYLQQEWSNAHSRCVLTGT